MTKSKRIYGKHIPTAQEICWFINRYQRDYGWAPSRRDVATNFQISLSTVQDLMLEARRAGLMDWGHGARQLRLLPPGQQLAEMKQLIDRSTVF